MSESLCQTPWLDDAVARLVAAAQGLSRRSRKGRGPAQLREELVLMRRSIDLIELEFAGVAAEFEQTDSSEWEGAASPSDWIRHNCRTSGVAANRALSVGRMEQKLPASTEALVDGRIGFGHLALLATTVENLEASGQSGRVDEADLLRQAEEHSVSRFNFDCIHARHRADAEAVLAEHVDRVERRRLELVPCGDGMIAVNGLLDEVGGATFRTALEALAQKNGFGDDRSRERRLADAAVELSNYALDRGSLPRHHSQRPHLQVTASMETLEGRAGAAAGELEFSMPIPSETVRRLGCDASLVSILLDRESAVMDVGRARRMPSAATRRAVNARDQGCVWPRCDRRIHWTTIHHVQHWGQNGKTELANLAAVCYRHHLLLHEGGWQMVRTDEGVLVVPPAVAPLQRPRAPDSDSVA